jgi:hypothetical protein
LGLNLSGLFSCCQSVNLSGFIMAVISLSIYLKVCLYKHIYIFQKSIGKLGHINLSTNIMVPTYFMKTQKHICN